jgi:hypothetical protein
MVDLAELLFWEAVCAVLRTTGDDTRTNSFEKTYQQLALGRAVREVLLCKLKLAGSLIVQAATMLVLPYSLTLCRSRVHM